MATVSMEPLGHVNLAKHFSAGYVPGDPNSPSHPTFIFERAHPAHVWLVASTPLVGDEIKWMEVHSGEHVMVPLFAYELPGSAELVFGFGMQMACLALGKLPCNVESMQLAIARPAEDLFPATGKREIRIHAGIALRVK